MILNSIKLGGNRTKDLEVGPGRHTDGRTDRQTDSYIPPPPQTTFAGGIIKLLMNKKYNVTITKKAICQI
jgi:hypothetical protein